MTELIILFIVTYICCFVMSFVILYTLAVAHLIGQHKMLFRKALKLKDPDEQCGGCL